MKEHKPFTEHWWWQKLLDHVYYCKWKYYDREEMKADCELTDFIINRIKTAQLRTLKNEINNRDRVVHLLNHGTDYIDKGEVLCIFSEYANNASVEVE